MADEERITGANDMRLVIRDEDDNKLGSTATMVVDDFEFQKSQDKPLQHGVGNEEPQGRVYGNKEYTFSFTIMGEKAELFKDIASPGSAYDAHLFGQTTKWIVRNMDDTQFTYSASDGDPVEFSAEMNALDYDVQDYNPA